MKVIAAHDFYNNCELEIPDDAHPKGTHPDIVARVIPMGTIFKIGGDLSQKEMKQRDAELLAKLAGVVEIADGDEPTRKRTAAILKEAKSRADRKARLAAAALPSAAQLLEQIKALQAQVVALTKSQAAAPPA